MADFIRIEYMPDEKIKAMAKEVIEGKVGANWDSLLWCHIQHGHRTGNTYHTNLESLAWAILKETAKRYIIK